MVKAKDFLTKEEQKEVVNAIKTAEKNTSGEIRLHIETENSTNEEDRTLVLFTKLKMDKTKLRNGVLIHLTLSNKSFSIYGDKGIHECVSQNFWDSIRDSLTIHFKENKYKEGLINAILETGEKLKQYFPYQSDDTNELEDEISFS